MEELQLVIFRLAAEEYAIPVADISEIVRYAGATKLPNTPHHVEGIINLRGKVIPVLDLRARFGFAEEAGNDKRALIMRAGEVEMAVVVDEVVEVTRLAASAIEAPPAMTTGAYISGIGKSQGRLLILLDVASLLAPGARSA